jgi:signal transduction histidine kinase
MRGEPSKSNAAGRLTDAWLPAYARLASLAAALIGATVLLGWMTNLKRLFSLHTEMVAMNPVTALMVLFLSLALARKVSLTQIGKVDRLGMALASIACFVGGIKILHYLIGFGFDIDQVLFSQRIGPAGMPANEMAPNTALNLVLCGLALIFFDSHADQVFRPAEALAIGAGLIALLALLGYAYRILSFYRLGASLPMALDTAVAFGFLVTGFLAARPERGVMKIITSSTSGGSLARRLLPMAILIPSVLGAMLVAAEENGFVEHELAVSFFAVSSILAFTGLIWWNARLLYRVDLQKLKAESRRLLQHNANRAIAESGATSEVVLRILREICQSMEWQVGALWVMDETETKLRCRDLWQDESSGCDEFVQETRERLFERGQGLPGRVWAKDAMVCVKDMATEPDISRSASAGRTGLHAGFGFPVRLGSKIFGVLEFFSVRTEEMDDDVAEILESVAALIGAFIGRREAEQQLRTLTVELERSNTDLQQFAYVASHDLFEPLRMVSSYLQLLTHRNTGKMDSESQEFVGFALDGARRMQALIKDLLAYSRVGSRDLVFEIVDLEAIVREALSNLKVAIEESGAVVTRQPFPRARGDAVQLTQVLQNLIGNAIKFRGNTRPEIDLLAERVGDQWTFSVRDHGIGIDAKDFERIFLIFQRLHTAKEYAGTGLGLAICKKIIERHGGAIWVESTKGKGTTFKFTLPALNP